MKTLMLLLSLWAPLSQEADLEVFVDCRTPEIFGDYRNFNFSQEVAGDNGGLRVNIKSRTLRRRHFNHRISGDERFLASQEPAIRRAFDQARGSAVTLAEYLRNLTSFLKSRIAYSEDDLPQEEAAVLAQGKGHCVGFANVARTMLAAAGIASRPVSGFFLRDNGGRIEPVPHRWLEIDLAGNRRVFYDPQHQDFPPHYLVAISGLPLERVERFAGIVVRKSKRIVE